MVMGGDGNVVQVLPAPEEEEESVQVFECSY